MKSLKVKLVRLPKTVLDDSYEVCTPSKKRKITNDGKENETLKVKSSRKSASKKDNQILKESLNADINAQLDSLGRDKSSDISDNDSDVFEEMFHQLKKNGIKTTKAHFSDEKKTKTPRTKSTDPKFSKEKTKSKNLSESKNQESTPVSKSNSGKRVKKKLIDDFENLDDVAKSNSKSFNSKSCIKVPELEKLPEDLILNYKRTPTKTKRLEFDCTPKKLKSVENSCEKTPKKPSSKKTIQSNEVLFTDVETTPRRKISRSSTKKNRETPELKTPTHSKSEQKLPTTPLEKAWINLQTSAVPSSLPCREKEFNNILQFVRNKLNDGIGGCMYISGVPGTGKTATVTQVIKHLQKCAENEVIPDFRYVEINGMRLADPRKAYVMLWQGIFDRKERISSDQAYKLLDKWFSKSKKKCEEKSTILLVDELDLICHKKQDVVYNLLDWPTRTHSRLVVLTIANTMDMPERFFKGRITSRMGLTRLTFTPYTYKQLEEIVLERLKGLDAFLPDAVQLVSRKVAAVSGDARRALDICRRAAEIPASNASVKLSHIEQAIKEMSSSNIVKIIRSCSHMEKLFLRSLCDVTFRSNVDEVDLLKVIDQLLTICVLEGLSRPSVSSILCISNRLKCCRLIFVNQSHAGILQRVMLNVTQDDIHYAMQC